MDDRATHVDLAVTGRAGGGDGDRDRRIRGRPDVDQGRGRDVDHREIRLGRLRVHGHRSGPVGGDQGVLEVDPATRAGPDGRRRWSVHLAQAHVQQGLLLAGDEPVGRLVDHGTDDRRFARNAGIVGSESPVNLGTLGSVNVGIYDHVLADQRGEAIGFRIAYLDVDPGQHRILDLGGRTVAAGIREGGRNDQGQVGHLRPRPVIGSEQEDVPGRARGQEGLFPARPGHLKRVGSGRDDGFRRGEGAGVDHDLVGLAVAALIRHRGRKIGANEVAAVVRAGVEETGHTEGGGRSRRRENKQGENDSRSGQRSPV